MSIKEITSRQNALVKQLFQQVRSNHAYLKTGEIWLEGEHLCQAYFDKMGVPPKVICSQSLFHEGNLKHLFQNASFIYLLDDALFKQISTLECAGKIGYLVPLVQPQQLNVNVNSIILDRLQDPGNVGSILRSAAAFGFKQVLALKGTCSLWAEKTLRAGMGAHFSLSLFEQVELTQLKEMQTPLLSTSSHSSLKLHHADLPSPCSWVLGHEGQGVSQALLELSQLTVCIEQPGGEESLNAAMAASICMYESVRQHSC